MAGLTIYIDKKKDDKAHLLKKIVRVNIIQSLKYNENYIIGEKFICYYCYPDFIHENKLAMIDEHIIIFEGEIYNNDELNKILNNKYLTTVEIIYHLYKNYGTKFVKYINGDFNIIIYNTLNDVVLFTNDRFARHPLFYYQTDDSIIIASEKKSILACLTVKPSLDYVGMLEVFAIKHNVLGRTFIENMFSCPPGIVFCCTNGKLIKDLYFNWYFSPARKVNKLSLIDEIYEELVRSTNVRLKDTNRTIILLSGGHDSRSILCALDKRKRGKISAITIGEDDSLEVQIARKICQTLSVNFQQEKISLSPSKIAHIGTWRSEFAVNALSHPFMSFHHDMKKYGDYILSGLPGLDTLNGCYIDPRVIVRSGIPKISYDLIFSYYLVLHQKILEMIFKKKFINDVFPQVKDEFIRSLKLIEAENKLDQYDIWYSVERQPQFSHMADLVDMDLFSYIPPYTDIKMHEIFMSIPTKNRMYKQISLNMIYKHFPEVRKIEYDSGRGIVKQNNTIYDYLKYGIKIKTYNRNYKKSNFWNFFDALNHDTEYHGDIIQIIDGSSELSDYVFNLDGIKEILKNEAFPRRQLIIGLLLTFVNAYKYLVMNNSNSIPKQVQEYYADFYSPESA